MAQDNTEVHFGPGRIFLGAPAPASGLPPTWAPHTAGVPDGGGTEVGFTIGDLAFKVGKATNDITAEQVMGAIDIQRTDEMVSVEFEALQRDYVTLKAAFDTAGGSVNDVNRVGFYGGGQAIPLQSQTVFVSSLRPHQAGKFEISMIYRAVSVTGYEIAYKKSGASTYKVTMRGLFDTTRVDGDRLYQHYMEK